MESPDGLRRAMAVIHGLQRLIDEDTKDSFAMLPHVRTAVPRKHFVWRMGVSFQLSRPRHSAVTR